MVDTSNYIDYDRFSFVFGDYGMLTFVVAIEDVEYVGGGEVEVDVVLEKETDELGGTTFEYELYVDGSLEDSSGADSPKFADSRTLTGSGGMGSDIKVVFSEDYGENTIELTGSIPEQDATISDVFHEPKRATKSDADSNELKVKYTVDNNTDMDNVFFSMSISGPTGKKEWDEVELSASPNSKETFGFPAFGIETLLGVDGLGVGKYKVCIGGVCDEFLILEEGDWPGWSVEGIHYEPPSPTTEEQWETVVYLNNDVGFDLTGVDIPMEYEYEGESVGLSATIDIPSGGKTMKVDSDTIVSELGHSSPKRGEYSVCIGE